MNAPLAFPIVDVRAPYEGTVECRCGGERDCETCGGRGEHEGRWTCVACGSECSAVHRNGGKPGSWIEGVAFDSCEDGLCEVDVAALEARVTALGGRVMW